MDTKKLTAFLLLSRTKTYAGNAPQVKAMLPGSRQYEHEEGEWLYRDIFNIGLGRFMGLEIIYLSGKPVWSTSYFGNFSRMSEAEVDAILRQALMVKKDSARLWKSVSWEQGDFRYHCDGTGTIEESSGTEEIYKQGKRVYYFYYASGLIA